MLNDKAKKKIFLLLFTRVVSANEAQIFHRMLKRREGEGEKGRGGGKKILGRIFVVIIQPCHL